jgi:hypothetical protein
VNHGDDGRPIAEAIVALCELHNEMWERYDAMRSTTYIELDGISNGHLPPRSAKDRRREEQARLDAEQA